MSNTTAQAILEAKMKFHESACEAIKDAATTFHKQTDMKPLTITIQMEFDCIEPGGRLEYLLREAVFNVDIH